MIVLPPNRIFEPAKPLEEAIGGSFNSSFTKLEKGKQGGMYAWSDDHILPRKGLVYPSATRHNNIMKSFFVFFLTSLGSFRPTVKWLDGFLGKLNRLSERIYFSEVPADGEKCEKCFQSLSGKLTRSDFMKFEYYNSACQELWHLVYLFFKSLGVSFDSGYKTGRLIATVFEYSPRFLMRLQDLFNEIDESSLVKSPRKELKRVFKIYSQREKGMDIPKFKLAMLGVTLLLLVPKFKKAFIYAVKQANWDKLRMDEIDVYWAMLDPTYDYFGEKIDNRHERFKNYCQARGTQVVFQ